MRWIKRILLVIVALVLLAAATVWAWGAIIIGKDYDVTARDVTPATSAAEIEEGRRLATVYGCYRGCHGKDMGGSIFVETAVLDRIVAPSITEAIDRYSDAEMEAIIRQGVKPDGHSVLGMPSASFASMTDGQLSAILGFIKQHPPREQDLGYSRYGFMARGLLIADVVKPSAGEVEESPWPDPPSANPDTWGRYLALNACSECHGMDFEGSLDFAPSLAVAKAYGLEDFHRLMRTGKGLGDRDLGLMSKVAQNRFEAFTDEEVDALHAFLQSL